MGVPALPDIDQYIKVTWLADEGLIYDDAILVK